MSSFFAPTPTTLKTEVSLAAFSTMRIGGTAAFSCTVSRKNELQNAVAWCKQKTLPFVVVGEGSNIVWRDNRWEGCVIQLLHEVSDIEVIDERKDSRTVSIPAGISWDSAVEWSCDESLHGIEMLSAIPGSAGAAVVQNIGAYGTELVDVFKSAEVFDTKTLQWQYFEKADCDFGYRSSIFKHKDWGRYVVHNVVLSLVKTTLAPIPAYSGVAEALKKSGVITPKPDDIRKVITDIRWSKLPKPSKVPNCGSYFENSFVTKQRAEELLKTHPNMPKFDIKDGTVKIPSAWLIEQCGWKGNRPKGIGPYSEHALVMTNIAKPKKALFAELENITKSIEKDVFEKFGITLAREVQWFPKENTEEPAAQV